MVQFGNPRSGLEAGRTPGAAVFGTGNGKRRGCIEWLFKCLLFLGEIAAQATDYRSELTLDPSRRRTLVSVIRDHNQSAPLGDRSSAFLL
jgi:hypothetical protein